MDTPAIEPKKLTIRIDQNVINSAKKYATKKEVSLSRLIEGLLQGVVKKSEDKPEKDLLLTPWTRSIYGMLEGVEAPEEEYRHYLWEKHQ